MHAVHGRERELALGAEFVVRAMQAFAALVLRGEAGVGKTTVWASVVERARAAGFLVLACRPAEAETKFALSALADLLEGVPEGAFEALPAVQRRALDAALLRDEATGEAAQPRTLSTAVRSLLAELSQEGPLLVAVDDVQWLDNASAEVLDFALRRLQAGPGGWLFAERTGVPCRLDVQQLVSDDALIESSVGPLTVAALHHMIKDRLGEPLPRSALVRIHEVSGGNPFYALEVAREIVRARPAAGGALPVPESVRDVLLRRLRRLPQETRDALLTAAALSDPTTALVDEGALRAAEEDDIVTIAEDGDVVFRHPLYASAVYGSASRSSRRTLHARLAEVVTDPEERARHLAAATNEPDEEIAGALVDGAAIARSRGALGSAAELLERAAELSPPDRPEAVQARVIAAAEHHIRAGDRQRAREILEAVLSERLTRPLHADAVRLLGEISYNDQNVGEAVRLFSEALELADDPRLANTIELGLAYVHAQLWDYPAATPHAHQALARAEAAPGNPLLAEALAYCAMFDYLSGDGLDWDMLERALALEDPHSSLPLPWWPSTLAGLLCAYMGRHAEGRQRLLNVAGEAVERGDESDVGFILLWLSWLATRTGDLKGAANLVDEASAIASATGGQATDAWTLAQRAYIHALCGDVAEARSACREASALLERFENVLARIWIVATLADLELSRGDAEAAWRASEPLVAMLEAQGIAEPVPAFFLPDALEALITIGSLDRAERLIDALEDQARRLDREWALAAAARSRALLLAARGDLEGAADAAARSLAEYERVDFPLERARTLLVAGVIQRRQRQRARAKESFERALEIFEEAGARLWAERAAAEIERVGLRRGSGAELTPSELRVAELVAKGKSNREVAAALSVSPKTVEANLNRIYRKLDIGSRAELGAHMAESLQK